MDILDPEVVWINGKCFRKLKIKDNEISDVKQSAPVRKKPIEFDDEDDCYGDVPLQMERGKFYAVYPVAQKLMGFLLGKSMQTKAAIEKQCSVTLKISEEKQMFKDVVILGETKEFVANAYRRIESIVYNARWKVGEYTHFISIPMNNEDLQIGFEKFKEEVLLNFKNSGISEDLFVTPSSLHLTVVMLTLFNERERENAKELLKNFESEIFKIIGDRLLRVEVKGVEYMNDDPGEVDVLYGKIQETDSSNCLQMIADKLADEFAAKNFAPKERGVKLHVTLIKSKRNQKGTRQTFDARKILAEYADYSFGFTTVSEIHISVRFTAVKNYYRSSFVLPLKK